jgi:hypothetical protein
MHMATIFTKERLHKEIYFGRATKTKKKLLVLAAMVIATAREPEDREFESRQGVRF